MKFREFTPDLLEDVSVLVREELPRDPFFSLLDDSKPLEIALRPESDRQAWVAQSPDCQLAGIILFGNPISAFEAATVAWLGFLRSPWRAITYFPSFFAASLSRILMMKNQAGDIREIITLVVSRSHRREGIGLRLVSRVTDSLTTRAVTLRSSMGAVALYKSAGFEEKMSVMGRVLLVRPGTSG